MFGVAHVKVKLIRLEMENHFIVKNALENGNKEYLLIINAVFFLSEF